jgi:hypothetical protein
MKWDGPEEQQQSGGDEIKLGDEVRVRDFRPDDLEGVDVGAGVESSPSGTNLNFTGLSESRRRLRPAGRGRVRVGVSDVVTKQLLQQGTCMATG